MKICWRKVLNFLPVCTDLLTDALTFPWHAYYAGHAGIVGYAAHKSQLSYIKKSQIPHEVMRYTEVT